MSGSHPVEARREGNDDEDGKVGYGDVRRGRFGGRGGGGGGHRGGGGSIHRGRDWDRGGRRDGAAQWDGGGGQSALGHYGGWRGRHGADGSGGKSSQWRDRQPVAGPDVACPDGRGGGDRPPRGGGGGRPPRGMRGKQIGLYYAARQKQKKRTVVVLPERHARDIEALMSVMRSEDFEGDSSVAAAADEKNHFMSAYRKNLNANRAKSASKVHADSREDNRNVDDEKSNDSLSDLRAADFASMAARPRYKQLLAFRRKLPAFALRDEILRLVRENRVVVVSGETGCGKTTQVPQFILDDALSSSARRCRVVCTQPRRISAVAVAERVADERGELGHDGTAPHIRAGGSVGYQIRLEDRLPRERGSIVYCTTGVALQWLRRNPTLRGVTHVVLDEVHERDTLTDFLITVLKDLLPARPDLKLILMSATLNADQFSRYFGGCPQLNIPGHTFHVEEFYLEDVLELTGFEIAAADNGRRGGGPEKWHKYTTRGRKEAAHARDFADFIGPFVRGLDASRLRHSTLASLSRPESEELNLELVARLLRHVHEKQPPGAVLVFLPGWDDISKLHKLLTEDPGHMLLPRGGHKIYPLHSMMPTVNQKEIFQRPPTGVRKIVISTNIAETSITIDDIVYVVDCGKIKLKNFDLEAGVTTLRPEWACVANARQRRGRAGRVQPGVCYHLFTRARLQVLQQFTLPEMLRTRLEEVILQIKLLELGDSASFLQRVMEPPSERAIDLAHEHLVTIGAIDWANKELTPLGFHLAQLPMDPQTGKMILLAAIFSCLDPILSVAASLSFKDPFVIPLGKEHLADAKRVELANGSKSDHLMLANAIARWEDHGGGAAAKDFCCKFYLSESTLRMLANMKRQFAEHLHALRFLSSTEPRAADANRNSGNEALVRAVVAAGLYPNVAQVSVRRNRRRGAFAVLTTEQERRVAIHPKSVNARESDFDYPYMVYHLLMKSSSSFIYDCSVASPLALSFFGRDLRRASREEPVDSGGGGDGASEETIIVDSFVRFNCSASTGSLVRELRRELSRLLERKVAQPGPTRWEPAAAKEGALLSAIVRLLTAELEGEFTVKEEDDDDDD